MATFAFSGRTRGGETVAGERMGGAMGRGHGGTGGDARMAEPPDQVGEHGLFATMEMGHAAGLDHQAVGRIHRHHGRVVPQRPEPQTPEGGFVRLGIGCLGPDPGNERLSLGGGHA